MPRRFSRRTALRAAGGALTTGLAGCSGLIGGGNSKALTLGTLDVFPMMQYFVIAEQGWYEQELDVDVTVEKFSGGPGVVQAYASGALDVAYVGISPGVIAIANGIPSQAVAANVLEPNVMVGNAEFRSYWREYGGDAFRKFREDKGRKPTFATLPAGSTPDVFLRYWITEALGLDLDESVTIKGMGATALRTTLAAGKTDGGSIIEPIRTMLVASDGVDMLPFRYAGKIMPGQPGAVLQPSQTLIENDPDLVGDLVRLHVRATEFINANKNEAAMMASAVMGEDVLPPEIAKQAIHSPASTFISDPHDIVEKTLVYNEFHQQLGKVDTDLTKEEIFEMSFYDAVTGE